MIGGEVCRLSSDPAFLCLWCRLAAIALTLPLAWELPYAVGVALKRQKKFIFFILLCTYDFNYISIEY